MKRFLAMLLTLVLLAGTVSPALAAETQMGYYGQRLTDPAAIAFYQALETMDFASGGNLPITDPAVLGLAEAYAGGSDAMIRSFGAAVDSFRYDHTEFFYVDWDMLSVNVGRQNGQYVVNIGTGRTDTYLRDKTANIAGQVTAYNTALDTLVAQANAKLEAGATIRDVARAANNAVCDAVTYDFCDDPYTGEATEASNYIRTAYGALVNGRAVCEGYSRLYKAVLNRLGVQCELVSGYYLNGESFEPHMWNYVKDEEGHWYAVDATMNDSSSFTANPQRKYETYFWQPEELFGIDHIEDGKVSSVEYEMPYPELYKFWQTPASSGKFTSGYGAYGDKSGFWFSYDGKSAADLEKEGLYMGFRVATTNTGEIVWSPWQTAGEMMRLYQPDGKDNVISDNDKTYILMSNFAMSNLEAGIFDIPEDAQNVVNGITIAKKYSEEAATSHLIEKMYVKNPGHDPTYIAPAYVHSTVPENLLQAWLDVTKGTQHVTVTYGDPLRVVEGKQFELDWSVSSYNRRDLSLEAVRQYAKVENVQFDGDRTISFDFTPSRMYNHNMIFYDFTVKNMVNIIADGKDGVAVSGFSIGCRYEDDIACCKIYNDGRLYVNSYAQPSIAMNGDLSTTGWTYKDTDGSTKYVSESQRSQVALVVTRPENSEDLATAAANKAGGAAVSTSKTYEIDLNICGKIVQIPNGSYMKLNLGIPDEFAGLVGKEDIKFKLYHFKRNADGTLDYNNPEEIECVLTPYGIIAEVNSFSPYVLVAVDESQLPVEARDMSKGVALVANGHGGKVACATPIVSLKEGEAATYTLTPDAGYQVEFVRLNDVDITPIGNTLTLAYEQLQSSSNTLEVGFVATSVKTAEQAFNIENVNPVTACTVTFDSNGGTAVPAARVKTWATVEPPVAPIRNGYLFDGWYTDWTLTTAYDFSTPVAASITLYAKWTAISGGDPTVTPPIVPTYPPVWPIYPPVSPTYPPVSPSNPPAWENDTPAWVNPFADVAENDWYYSAVQFATDNGLFLGTGAAAFTPNGDMTRGMLAAVLYRLAQEPEIAADQSFNDVAGWQYYAKAVNWAAATGIVSGYGNGNFGPETLITREQLAVILWRYAGCPASTGSLDIFTDANMVSTWAVDALQWAVEQNLISGKGGGILDPGGKATRAQVAAILMRYCGAAR